MSTEEVKEAPSAEKKEDEKPQDFIPAVSFNFLTPSYDILHSIMPGHTHLQDEISNRVLEAAIEMGKGLT